MLTELGKFLRVLRMNRGELLKDMADKLVIAPSYLSSIENGKRTPTKALIQKIGREYFLTSEEMNNLLSAYEQTIKEVTINLQFLKEDRVDLSVVFARRLNELSDEEITAINKILVEGRS